jgi:hypothetical protein
MGHQKIGRPPETRKWKEVVALLLESASAELVASKTFDAADSALRQAGNDPAIGMIFYLLTQLPLAARSPDPSDAFWQLGFKVRDISSPEALCSGLLQVIDGQLAQQGWRSDIAELAALSAAEALYAFVEDRSKDMFATRPTIDALAELRTPKNFGDLTKGFLARFLDRNLGYYLSRELPRHIGAQSRFSSVREHHLFTQEVATHCSEVAEIARVYAGDWYSKAAYEETLTPASARRGLAFAFGKLRSELVLR